MNPATGCRHIYGHIGYFKRFKGHAHWQNVAKIKGKNDKAKAALNTKWIPRIRAEAKNESDLLRNKALAKLCDLAKQEGVPASAIKNAVECWQNLQFTECQFGIQGTNGIIALIDCATPSKAKSENDIRTLLHKHNFRYGSVSFLFDKLQDVECDLPEGLDEGEIEEIALQCGTEEYIVDEDNNTITLTVSEEDQQEFFREIKAMELNVNGCDVRYVPQQEVTVDDEKVQKRVYLFMNSLDNMLEVEKIYHNVSNMQEIRALTIN